MRWRKEWQLPGDEANLPRLFAAVAPCLDCEDTSQSPELSRDPTTK